MDNESITIYKLIILYALGKVNTPLPPGIISDYITGQGYTNFFNVQNAFGELLKANLIAEDATYHLSYYKLTDAGRATLESFGTRLSKDIREELDDYLTRNRYEIINETSLVSDYRKAADGNYLSTCTLREGNQILFELTLNVAKEEDAIRVCENWRQKSSELYQSAMQTLLPLDRDNPEDTDTADQ